MDAIRWEPPHDPNETETRNVEFPERLADGETIQSAIWTSTPAGLSQVSASVSTDGLSAVWKFSGGTAGVDYDITVRATTTGGNILERSIILRCRDR
jgi:hypothetical protein